MAKWKFRVSYLEYGVLEVIADTKEDAMDKAFAMDGTFHHSDGEVTEVVLISSKK